MSQVTPLEAETSQIPRIIRILESTNALDLLHDKWSSLARALGIPSGQITKIRGDLQHDKIFLGDALNQILEVWHGRCGSDATPDKLIGAFEDLDLNSFGEALRLEFNLPCKGTEDPTLSWNDIGSKFKKKVENNLAAYYPTINFDNELKSKLTGEELVDLMTGKEPISIKNIIPETLKYYVPRTLIARNALTDKLFDYSSHPDTFLFTGIERHQLSSKAGGQPTDTTTNQLDNRDPMVKYMVLDMPNHFTKICSSSTSPVHLIKFEDDKFCWVQSINSLDNIRTFTDKYQIRLSESEFLKTIGSSSVSNLPMIISDSPGMGKSEILKQMARNISTLLPEKIIIFQEFPNFVDLVIRHHKANNDLHTSIQIALQDLTCKSELGVRILNSKSSSESTSVELLLDGYDELNWSSVKIANDILREIHSSFRSIHLWVTTRPHLLQGLENMLTVLGYTIQSFTREDQINFLTSFWSREKNWLPIDRLTQYAANCLKYLKSTLTAAEEDIAGIPLQCLMIGEVFEEEAIDYAQSDAGFSAIKIRVTTIADLYNLTIEKKLKKYQSSSTYGRDKLNDNELINMHFQLGLKLIFPDYFKQINSSFSKILEGDVLNVGVLECKGSEGELYFIHRTFAEYFVALFFVNMLSGKYNLNDDGHDYMTVLPPKEVLACTKTLQREVFKYPVICFFINSLLRASEVEANIGRAYVQLFSDISTLKELAGACVNSDSNNIFNLFERFNAFVDKYGVEIYTVDLVLNSIAKSRMELIRKTITGFERFNKFGVNIQAKVLCHAVQRGDFTPVEFLVNEKQIHRIIKDGENYRNMLLLHYCVESTTKHSDDIIRQKMDVIQYLVQINPLLLEEENHKGNTPLVCDNVHVQLLIKLIEVGSNVFATDHHWRTILHFTGFSPDEYHSLLASMKTEDVVMLVKMGDDREDTPLLRLIKGMNPKEATLNIFKDTGADFNISDKIFAHPLLAIAIENGGNIKTLQKLIECGSDVNWLGPDEQNLMHIASSSCNLDAISVLAEYNVDINAVDDFLNTPLHTFAKFHRSPASSKVIKSFIDCGGNVSMQNSNGNTFLHELFSRPDNISSAEFHNVIELMIQLKCSHVLEIENNIGSSPIIQRNFRVIAPQGEFLTMQL